MNRIPYSWLIEIEEALSIFLKLQFRWWTKDELAIQIKANPKFIKMFVMFEANGLRRGIYFTCSL